MKVYLIRLSGDVTYRKSSSRFYFEDLVIKNIKYALRKHEKEAKIIHEPARIYVEDEDIDSSIFKRIFGISSFSECEVIQFSNLEDLAQKIEERYKEEVKGKSFAIRCQRSGKHDFTSMDAAKMIGAKLKPYALKVNLENPDVEINVEIRDDKAYVFKERIAGPGGLPIGVGEHVLSLFSGGFDSPVASWFIAKRGCKVDFLHFAFGGLSEVYPVYSVAKFLYENWFYGYKPRFFVVRFAEMIKEIMLKIPNMIRQVALRRFMYLAAEKIALKNGHEALVTGEALSQATSQTMRNLRVAEFGISLPIIRPLIGFDKQEIITLSRNIGTYELSLKVEELCGIAVGPLTPKADIDKFFNDIQKIDFSILDKLIAQAIELDLDESDEKIKELLKEEEFVINYIPTDSVVVNLMPDKFSIHKAISFNEFDEEKYKDSLIIFVCEKGLTSKGLAKYYREKGYKAYSLEGGFEGYKKILKSNTI
ncbi:MAG: tRNA uracil 4-sulfurtransferase ThiI [Thermoproteota archaeon]|nr:tRNA uracil 4-sulfurtransferase ThiI [Thermoproteota archaeon]